MAADPRKRQKKQQRRAAKRKAKYRVMAREKSRGFASQLATAAHYPVLHSSITQDLWTGGLGWVCVSRELPNGAVAFAMFLVDRYCLGVKNAMAQIASRFDYESNVQKKMREQGAQQVHPSAARKLVESAVEYARALGFHPHADYAKARHIFGDIDPAQCTEEFEFGKDGKPFFIAGPYDTPNRCQMILKTLERTRGPGRYEYVMPVPGSPPILEHTSPEELEWEGSDAVEFADPEEDEPPRQWGR